jgi:hypothetical protein
MAKMTKAQAKKRLNEALAKVKLVYISHFGRVDAFSVRGGPVDTTDMRDFEKVINRCLKRIK